MSVSLTPTLESEAEAQQSLGIYCEAIATLPEKCRRVFLLRKVYGLKQREIAESLGISVRMVEKHMKIGTLKCREYVLSQPSAHESRQGKSLRAECQLNSLVPKEGLDQ